MNAIDALLTRKSAAKLVEPAPDDAALQTLFQAAVRAPDHGCIRPWRFIYFKDEMRHELGQIFVEALKKSNPEATPAAIEKEAKKPLRAPLVIAVIAKVQEHPKVPAVEQIISAGAAAQNIMIAAHAMGYAGIWRSGSPCFDEHVRSRLGAVGDDMIVGFLYLGTAKTVPPMPDLSLTDYVSEWKSA
ncbi:nitroreductase [Sneathiella sp.]|jgi:nitroreductase|uniref:nitroreductase family protein n=1 Tax=Sneathiella sp. TaxID=1964365 RepID=UPI0039E4A1E4